MRSKTSVASPLFTVLPAAAVVLAMTGCPKPVPPQVADEYIRDELATPPDDGPAEDVESPVDCDVLRVPFAYDSASLSSQAQRILQDNAECIERRGLAHVTIEGHCCELGSTEYNLALGQRRADAIRRYLTDLGVDTAVLRSISYGEERPLTDGQGEATWSQNRRGEFVCDDEEPVGTASLDAG